MLATRGMRLLAALLLIVSLAAATAVFRLPRRASTDVPLYTVRPQNFVRWVTAEGHLEAVRAKPIQVPSAVRQPYQIAWLAPEGQPVKAGEIVLRFDPTGLESTLEEALAGRRSAELKIARESKSAEARRRNLQRDAELAGSELELVRAFPKRDETIFSRNELIGAEVDEQLAEQRQRHAEATRETTRALARAELELLALERRKSDLELRRSEKALGLLEVAAPHDGILILERGWSGEPLRVGDTVFSGQKVAELPDLSEMKAEVFVLEADAGGLAVGQPATVTVESRPEVAYRSKVRRVDTLAKPRLRGSPVQYFGASLELESTDPEVMKPGQRVSAVILLDDLRDVLVVPRQALVERDGRHLVFKRVKGGFEEVEVTLGVAGLGRVVVTGGLGAGDVVAAREPGRTVEPPAEPAGEAGATVDGRAAGGR